MEGTMVLEPHCPPTWDMEPPVLLVAHTQPVSDALLLCAFLGFRMVALQDITGTLSRFITLTLRVVSAIVLLEIWGIHFQSLLAVGGVSGVAQKPNTL